MPLKVVANSADVIDHDFNDIHNPLNCQSFHHAGCLFSQKFELKTNSN